MALLHFSASSHLYTRWWFLRMLGIIYLMAFWSFSVQLPGLIGDNGILPAKEFLQNIQNNLGSESYWRFPTFAWFDSSTEFLTYLSWGGVLLSLLLIFNIMPTPALIGLWGLYLSLVNVGQNFMSFQWDILLLETGFLAIFFSSWHWFPKPAISQPPSWILWLFRWLLFRLYFLSGWMKLSSGDPTWRNLTALNFHYETQPLPNPIAWYFHQFPEWFQQFSVLSMFFIELIVPFFIFGPRRLRLMAAGLMALLQIMLLTTGNYTFFNWLTLALCFLLLDDKALSTLFPKSRQVPWFQTPLSPLVLRFLISIVAISLFALSGIRMTQALVSQFQFPSLVETVLQRTNRLHIVNHYGLFAVMTKLRPEIIIQGSQNGEMWLDYEFKYKPGDVQRALPWVAPHQPRLDWQMWFAALGTYQNNPWFIHLMLGLLQGAPTVSALLETNPYSDHPPKYLRALVYRYRFTDSQTRKDTQTLWIREQRGVYVPSVTLNSR